MAAAHIMAVEHVMAVAHLMAAAHIMAVAHIMVVDSDVGGAAVVVNWTCFPHPLPSPPSSPCPPPHTWLTDSVRHES